MSTANRKPINLGRFYWHIAIVVIVWTVIISASITWHVLIEKMTLSHGCIWLFGLICIIIVAILSRQQLIENRLSQMALIKTNQELDQRVRIRTQELEKKTHELKERVKELNCLYGFSRLVETSGYLLEDICLGIVNLIPPSWQYPEVTCARLIIYDKEYKTDNFAESKWNQTENVKVRGKSIGWIEVYYTEERPDLYEGPFSKEERDLLHAIAEHLEKTIAYVEIDEELKLSLEFNLKIIEESPVGIIIYDDKGCCITANTAVASLLGTWKEEVRKQNYHNITSWKESGLYDAALCALAESKARQHEINIKSSFGKEIHLDCYLVPLDKGQLLLMANDISAYKKAEEELRSAKDKAESASQMKSKFLASMSHELRTPLNAVIGFSEILQEQYFGKLNEKQEHYVQGIYDSGNLLLSLINDILDLSKIEAGMMDIDYSQVNIKSMVESSMVMVREKALRHGIALDLHIPDKLEKLHIMADERKLKQILVNLLSNALKFTPEGGQVSIEVDRNDKEVIISVQDTGIGIEKKYQKEIFHEFFQVKNGLTDKTPGTGLGLSLVRRIVELHKGKVRLESEGKNKGCRFSFSLPFAPGDILKDLNQDPGATASDAYNGLSRDMAGKKVLIAEDNPQNLKRDLKL